MLTVDNLAQEIRRVDGNHSLGAGALAEALMPFFAAALAVQTQQGVNIGLKGASEIASRDLASVASVKISSALVDVPAVESEPVALIEREVLAELQKHWSTTGTVCSPLFKSKFGDKVPLFAHPPRSLSNEGWRPIETAPKDGEPVLLWQENWLHAVMGRWSKARNGWVEYGTRDTKANIATHWQPLPNPPLSTRKGSSEGDGSATITKGRAE